MVFYKNELYHFGIKGQKKGERHYQTQDGTWTEEGLARRRKQAAAVSGVTKNTGDIIKNLKDLNNKRSNNIVDLSQYSNKDLQEYITRKNLERQYLSISGEDKSVGKETCKDILETVGSVVAIVGGVAGVASSIYAMKSK